MTKALTCTASYCMLPDFNHPGLVLILPAPKSAFATGYTFPGCGATIQACINSAANGDTISISAGVYTESLTLNKAISLTGALSTTTKIHAISSQRVITVTGSVISNSVVISGLTFYGGNTSAVGGGMVITNGASIQLTNVVITNNVANDYGGGIFIDFDGALTMMTSQVLSNTTSGASGGGIHNNYGTLIVTNSGFKNNRSLSISGGGIMNWGAATLINSAFENNSASPTSGSGGAVSSVGGTTLVITNTSFINNSGSGGVVDNSGVMTIADSTFYANNSTGMGAASALADRL